MAATKGAGEQKILSKATFAGGCFWCMEQAFDGLEGVIDTTVGYTGGLEENPTYEEVCSHRTGHVEAIEVTYDPGRIPFEQLLEVFWKNIDPTQSNGQFADMGEQYRTVIFYHDEAQRKAAETSRKRLGASGKFGGKEIATLILPAVEFYPAEDDHQQYYRKEPMRYQSYKWGSGRGKYLQETWGNK